MHVLLVGPDLEENLSLRYLASSLRQAGHVPTIATFDTRADTDAVVAAAGAADLIALSMCYQIRAQEFLDLAKALKSVRPDRAMVAGGHYASCAAIDLLAHHSELDVIVVHEGEQTLVEIASLGSITEDALAGVCGIVHRRAGTVVATAPRPIQADLNALAWPERSGPARLMGGVPTAYMMGSRGCVYSCDYCCITTLHRLAQGRRFRQRSPENIAEEMSWLYHARGVRQFIFHDDNFLVPSVTTNLERIDALDSEMRRRGIRDAALALKCRPAEVNRQVFARLREMGLLRIFLGIESGSAAGLASIGRDQTIEDEHRALSICEEMGVSTQYTIILFHPEATAQTMLDDLAFVRRHPAHPLSFCRAEIYAGTPLEKRMVATSRARGDYLARVFRYADPVAELAWSYAGDVLRDRCLSEKSLLGQIIRLDHLAAIFGTFYAGYGAEPLVRAFADWEVEVNLDTVDLLEDLVRACQTYPDRRAPELQARMDELLDRERTRRQVFEPQACGFRETFDSQALALVGLSGAPATSPHPPVRSFERPRHAAAVLLAIGLLQCGGETAGEGGGGSDGEAGRDAPAVHAGGGGGWKNQGGANEAAPPPMGGSSGKEAGGAGGAAGRGGAGGAAGKAGWVNQGGMWEAPPPPMGGSSGKGGRIPDGGGPDATADAARSDSGAGGTVGRGGWVNQGGMWEAPPPPMGGSSGRGGEHPDAAKDASDDAKSDR